jgi:mRNA deadenylase 3'-5' endonuclease subunit Ccr4
MLTLFADCLLLATRLPAHDVRLLAMQDRRREDEEWLMARRAQRALDYAERAQTMLAYELALRELAREIEEEEALLMLLLSAA